MSSSDFADQGSAFTEHTQWHLEHELERRDAVNKRAAQVLASSTGIVTVVVALLAALKGKDAILSGAAAGLLAFAVFSLLFAALAALAASWPGPPFKYDAVSETTLDKMLTEHWTKSETTARAITARANLTSIISLRKTSGRKYWVLMVAYGFQALATVFAAICVFVAI